MFKQLCWPFQGLLTALWRVWRPVAPQHFVAECDAEDPLTARPLGADELAPAPLQRGAVGKGWGSSVYLAPAPLRRGAVGKGWGSSVYPGTPLQVDCSLSGVCRGKLGRAQGPAPQKVLACFVIQCEPPNKGEKKSPVGARKKLFFEKRAPLGQKKGRPRPLEQHRVRSQNLQKTTQTPPKTGPGAPPGCPGDAP